MGVWGTTDLETTQPLMNPVMMLHNFVMLFIFSKGKIQLYSSSHIGFMRVTRKCYSSHLSHKDSAKFIHILKVTLGADGGAETRSQSRLSALLSPDSWPREGFRADSSPPQGLLDLEMRGGTRKEASPQSFLMSRQECNVFPARALLVGATRIASWGVGR